MHPKYRWTARFAVAILMLTLAFLGILITDFKASGGWSYWKWTIPVYAILALWLSWYERRGKEVLSPITIWHEVLHWFALFAVTLLIEIYVHMGLLSRSLASLFALTTLALTVFTIGIYVESTFLLIGIVLGVFAAIVAFAIKFLYALAIPVLLIGVAIVAYMIWRSTTKK